MGLPLDDVQTRLRHEDGSAAPHDGETIGSLQVRTPTLFDGYLNRPDATAEAFEADGWYRAGDAAVIDGGGIHRIVGRESVDLIKSGGYRIGAGEVETVLLAHPGVTEAAVVGLPDEDLGQRIVAFVVGDAGSGRPDFVCRRTAFGPQAGGLQHPILDTSTFPRRLVLRSDTALQLFSPHCWTSVDVFERSHVPYPM